QHVLEALLVERQRVAARDQAVADLRRCRDVLDGLVDIGLAQRALAARAHEARPRAVAAIDRTEVRHEQQHAIGVAVHETRRRAVAVLAERVLLLAGAGHELGERRYRRPANALVRVRRVYQAHVVRRDTDRQRTLVASDRGAFFIGDFNDALELLEAADAIAVLPTPVVPLGGFDAGEVPLAELVGP